MEAKYNLLVMFTCSNNSTQRYEGMLTKSQLTKYLNEIIKGNPKTLSVVRRDDGEVYTLDEGFKEGIRW